MNFHQIFEDLFETVVPYHTKDEIAMLYYLARRSKAKVTLEVGVYHGATSLVLALAVKENGGIHHAIDNVQEHLDRFEKLAEQYGVKDNIRTYCADSGRMDWEIPLDLAFIDGDHNTEYVLRDIDVFGSKIKKGGLLCFHDSFSHDNPGVGKALELRWDDEKWDRLELPYGEGLTIWRLR